MVKIRHSGIVVRDLVASLDFYLAFGFSVVSDQLESGKFIDDILGFNNSLSGYSLNISMGSATDLINVLITR